MIQKSMNLRLMNKVKSNLFFWGIFFWGKTNGKLMSTIKLQNPKQSKKTNGKKERASKLVNSKSQSEGHCASQQI